MIDKKILPMVGMMYASCSAHVECKLSSIEGVKFVSIFLPGRTAMMNTILR